MIDPELVKNYRLSPIMASHYDGSSAYEHEAESNVMSVTFDIFKSQVLSYLPPDYQRQYDSHSVWDDMVLRVVEALREEES